MPEPKSEMEEALLGRLITHLAHVYHVSLRPSDAAEKAPAGRRDEGGGAGAKEGATADGGLAGNGRGGQGDGEGTPDVAWQQQLMTSYTLGELVWGTGVEGEREGGEDGVGGGRGVGVWMENSETETESDDDGIDGFYSVRFAPQA